MNNNKPWSHLELETKPDFGKCIERIYAWYNQELIDRPPIRFSAHNAEYNAATILEGRNWPTLKERWFDAEYQIELFLHELKHQKFLAETFPCYWPNLGPEVYSAFYGSELIYQEVTAYSAPLIKDWTQAEKLTFNINSEYYLKLEQLTELALAQCKGKFLVGYTDLHPGTDCAAAWRDPQEFCLDLILNPDEAKKLIDISYRDFFEIFDRFDKKLKQHGQPSITWMSIPSFGKMHIPSCDFSAMISPEQFNEFILPGHIAEVKHFDHNIYHLDGKGVAKHIDRLLEIKEINAIQWVQGMGDDTPIMQWEPLIKKIQKAGKSIIIDLQVSELEAFISTFDKKGVYLCIAADYDIQPDIIKRVEKW